MPLYPLVPPLPAEIPSQFTTASTTPLTFTTEAKPMKNVNQRLIVPVLALSLLVLPGCLAGPDQLSRGFDDWVNQKYSEDSRVHGLLLQNILPVYPVAGLLLGFVDLIVINPYFFWSEDVWDGRGSAFKHTETPVAPRVIEGSF